jgi:hypothetical protein
MKRIYLSAQEVQRIAATPKRECWICDKLINNVYEDTNGYFLKEKKFIDDGIVEHLRQIINREVIFK